MARKIEQQVTNAIRARRNFSGGNTTVSFDGQNVGTVHLHGNKIATFLHGRAELTWAGWNTTTTRSRLNAVLAAVAPDWRALIVCRSGQFWNATTNVDHIAGTLSVPMVQS